MYSSTECARRIRLILKIKKIKVIKLCDDLQFNRNFISQIETLKKGISAGNLYAICEYLQVSADFLLGLTDTLVIDNLAYTIKTHTEIVKTDSEKIEV